MHHPYQCLQVCSFDRAKFLLAASGSRLSCVNLEDGSIVSSWPTEEPKSNDVTANPSEVVEPPSKKRKVSNATHEDPPNIIHIVATESQHHAVVVTGEDKCLRVFEIGTDGNIQQLTQRCMPKKPCAVKISPDDRLIISGDKFGDVYSLPLLPTAEEDAGAVPTSNTATTKMFAPTATEQTVHSKANRKALEAQKKQAKIHQPAKSKEPLAFAHELLLGHVSLLTDVLIATVESDLEDAQSRTYILTSDRDEHIRISRGPPQSFVIEGFCLGHGEFINKMCLPEPTLLVSGGGDSELYVWNWLTYTLTKKIKLLDAVLRVMDNLKQGEKADESELDSKIAVSGLWTCPGPTLGKAELIISCEGVPALFHLPVSSLRDSQDHDVGFIPLTGNPLAIAVLAGGIIVSIDTIHKPGFTSVIDESEDFSSRLQAFDLIGADLDGGGVWKANDHLNHILVDLNEQSSTEWHEEKLQALLYGVENMRKRKHDDPEAENEVEAVGIDEE